MTEERKTKIKNMELEKVLAEEGHLSVDNILARARKKNHALHVFFEWDNDIAGEKYRRDQALQMIVTYRSCEKIKDEAGESVFQFPAKRAVLPVYDAGKFLRRIEVLTTENLRANFVKKRADFLREWCNSVSDVDEFDDIRRSIERWLKKRFSAEERIHENP